MTAADRLSATEPQACAPAQAVDLHLTAWSHHSHVCAAGLASRAAALRVIDGRGALNADT
ncbi:hypothetical protein ABZ154_33065 [Streptomyces sp. NPDC006261]|uniref:hypothetical protein n=1 Tax=Streptomyces sp. NPDC006261 TaxID=3156739 RepID=UPI0033AED633